MQYHYCAQGYLAHYPDLLVQLPDLSAALNTFTDRGAVLAYTSDLRAHLAEVRYLYGQGDLTTTIRKQSIVDIARPAGPCLKAALPSAYDGTSGKARTFLTECQTFMHLTRSSFPNNQVKILWALQLCLDKAANWKCIQTELLVMISLFFLYFSLCRSVLLLPLHSAPSPTHNPPIFQYFVDRRRALRSLAPPC